MLLGAGARSPVSRDGEGNVVDRVAVVVKHPLQVGLASLVDNPTAGLGQQDGLLVSKRATECAYRDISSLPEEMPRGMLAVATEAGGTR